MKLGQCPRMSVLRVYQHLRDNGCFPGMQGTAERMHAGQGIVREAREILEAAEQTPGISSYCTKTLTPGHRLFE